MAELAAGVAEWAAVLSDATVQLARLHREAAELEVAEIRGRAEALSMSYAKSASAAEQEAKVVTAEIKAEITKLRSQIAGLGLVHQTVSLFLQSGVPYTPDLNPLR